MIKWRTIITSVLGLLVITPIVLVLAKCTAVHFTNDADAERLLQDIERVHLLESGRVVYQGREVGGGYFSATGDSTDILAYRIFLTDTPPEKPSVLEYRRAERREQEIGVFPLNQPPKTVYLPMDAISIHVAQKDRNHAYVLYSIAHGGEDGFWDIRGW
jgi:hypothetical protein